MKYVVEYGALTSMEAAQATFAAHRGYYSRFVEAGSLILICTFTDRSGALSVFNSREAAEEFVRGDPFVVEGVGTTQTIREWNEVLSGS